MILPLVGPAGAMTPHAKQNSTTFLGALMVALVLSVIAIISKLERRKIDDSPLPHFSILLCGLCILLLFATLTGLTRI